MRRLASCAFHQPSLVLLLVSSKRSFVNCFFRLPPASMVPTHNSEGEEVDGEKFLSQFIGLINCLRQTALIDKFQEMRATPYFDAIFASDLLVGVNEMIIPMPKLGREHRQSEISETIRYCRGVGMSGQLHTALQDQEGARAHAGDFINWTNGIIMGYGDGVRTNELASRVLVGGKVEHSTDRYSSFPIVAIKLLPDSPPLADVAQFAGVRTLIVKANKHGEHVAQQVCERVTGTVWQVLRVPDKCNVVSHYGSGMTTQSDIVVDQEFPDAYDIIGEAGFVPHVCDWSEPRKLGVSMRSCLLIMRFTRGGLAGGFSQSRGHTSSTKDFQSSKPTNSKVFSAGQKIRGDSGAGQWSQMHSENFPTQNTQSTPRYRPPMHRSGELQLASGQFASSSSSQEQQRPFQGTWRGAHVEAPDEDFSPFGPRPTKKK